MDRCQMITAPSQLLEHISFRAVQLCICQKFPYLDVFHWFCFSFSPIIRMKKEIAKVNLEIGSSTSNFEEISYKLLWILSCNTSCLWMSCFLGSVAQRVNHNQANHLLRKHDNAPPPLLFVCVWIFTALREVSAPIFSGKLKKTRSKWAASTKRVRR